MVITRRIAIGLSVIVLLVGGAFAFERAFTIHGGQNGKLIPVMQDNKNIAYLDSATIRQLHQQEQAQEQGLDNRNNEVSLLFALGSAGLIDYKYIEIIGIEEGEYLRLGQKDLASVVLSANSDRTVGMINKANNQAMTKAVLKICIVKQ